MKDKISKLGYSKNSPFKNRSSLDINSSNITMRDTLIPLLGISKETGEQKIMLPGQNYNFMNTKTVQEIPLFKKGGKWIQKAVKHPGRCTPGSPNYDCPKGSPQWNLAQTFKKHHGFHKKQEGGIQENMTEGQILSSYLLTLPEQEQDLFIDSYDAMSPESKKMVLMNIVKPNTSTTMKKGGCMKCGGKIKYKKGGKVKELEQNVLKDIPVYPEFPKQLSTAEVEGDETLLDTKGQLFQFEGDKHSEGGINTYLEPGDKIFSDFLKVPKETANQILGKESKKKYSFADLSKKFPTQPHKNTLEDKDSDEFELETARLSLIKNQGMLETLFTSQELMKEQKGTKRKFQSGGVIPSPATQYFDYSGVSSSFKRDVDGNLYNPVTGVIVIRDPNSGLYTTTGQPANIAPRIRKSLGKVEPSIPNADWISNIDYIDLSQQEPVSASPLLFDPNKQDNVTSISSGYTPTLRNSPYNVSVNGVNTEMVLPQGQGQVGSFPYPTVEDLNPQGSTTTLDLVDPRSNSNVQPNNKRPLRAIPGKKTQVTSGANSTNTVTTKPLTPKPFDNFGQLPLPGFTPPDPTVNDRTDVESLIQPIPTSSTSSQLKESWFNRNKDKFGINSKLAGTILDIGMTLSDSVSVTDPTLQDRRKTPIFNRFYEFDDKEAQKMFSTQVQQINNSNLPEAVKQAQIAEVTSNMADFQGKVDLANAQRYEGKREQDLNKLQTYMDSNIDTKVQDLDTYQQRKARVDYLRDRFNQEKKTKLFNSVRNYLDYTDQLNVANQLSEHYTINPITGKLKVKPKQNTQLKDNLLTQFSQQQNNTIALPNGASATQIGNFLIVTGPDGKSEVREIGGK